MANILLIEEVAALPSVWLSGLHAAGHRLFRSGSQSESSPADLLIAWVADPARLRTLLAEHAQTVSLAVIGDGVDAAPWSASGVDDLVQTSLEQTLFQHRVELLLRLQEQNRALQEAQAQLARLAVTDPLTGVFNRAHFLSLAHNELSRSLRFSVPFSLIMIDIDQFKERVAQQGEEVANRLLLHCAEICQAEVRQVDILGRMSGSEFGICCPETPLVGARTIAERIRAAMVRSMPSIDEPLRFTISGGLATLEELEMDLGSVLGRADRALAEAQSRGGNRMVVGSRKSAL